MMMMIMMKEKRNQCIQEQNGEIQLPVVYRFRDCVGRI